MSLCPPTDRPLHSGADHPCANDNVISAATPYDYCGENESLWGP